MARVVVAVLALAVIAPVVWDIRLYGAEYNASEIPSSIYLTVWMGGSAVLMAVIVIWADQGSRARLIAAVSGSIVYAVYTIYIYFALESRDPLAGFALIVLPPGQWVIVGITAIVVRLSASSSATPPNTSRLPGGR